MKNQKIIYSGNEKGLYGVSKFKKFMNEFNGATTIFDEMNPMITPREGIYHIIPKNVTLKYESRATGGGRYNVLVTLFGEEKGISDVEKLVLEEAKGHITVSMMSS